MSALDSRVGLRATICVENLRTLYYNRWLNRQFFIDSYIISIVLVVFKKRIVIF